MAFPPRGSRRETGTFSFSHTGSAKRLPLHWCHFISAHSMDRHGRHSGDNDQSFSDRREESPTAHRHCNTVCHWMPKNIYLDPPDIQHGVRAAKAEMSNLETGSYWCFVNVKTSLKDDGNNIYFWQKRSPLITETPFPYLPCMCFCS